MPDRESEKREFLRTHPPSGGVDDDPNAIPDDPPGDPTADPTLDPDKKPDPVVAAPTFSATDVRNIMREVVGEFQPKRIEPTFDGPVGPDPVKLQAEIDEIDNQIDQAAQDGKPTRALLKARDAKVFQKYDTEYVQPLRSQGSQSINDLVLNQIASDPKLGEIFSTYKDEVMTILTPGIKQGQALRLDWVREATRMVAGRHLDEINEKVYEQRTRAAKLDSPTAMPGSTNGRARATTQDKEPTTVREAYGDHADEAFRFKSNKGQTPDTFSRSLGFSSFKEMVTKDRELTNNPHLGLDK
jgi:hypothetical protein